MIKLIVVSGVFIVIVKKIVVLINILVIIDMWGSKGIEILVNKKFK